MRVVVASILAASIGGVVLSAARPTAKAPPPPAAAEQRALVDRYCVGCHNQRQKVAGLTLDTVDVGDAANAETLEKVVRKLRSGSMPPAGMPRPDAPTLDRFVGAVE